MRLHFYVKLTQIFNQIIILNSVSIISRLIVFINYYFNIYQDYLHIFTNLLTKFYRVSKRRWCRNIDSIY